MTGSRRSSKPPSNEHKLAEIAARNGDPRPYAVFEVAMNYRTQGAAVEEIEQILAGADAAGYALERVESYAIPGFQFADPRIVLLLIFRSQKSARR